jgi:hypothetical protein
MWILINGRLIEKSDKVAKILISRGRAVQADRPEMTKKETIIRTPEGGVKSPGRPPKNKK